MSKHKLTLLFVLAALIASISGCIGITMIKSFESRYNNALVTYGAVQVESGNFTVYLNKCNSLLHEILTFTDSSKIKEAQEELKETEALTLQSLDNIKRFCQSPNELEIVKKMDQFTLKYNDASKKAIELSLQNRTDEALSCLQNDASSYLNDCITASQELMNYNETIMNTISYNLNTNSNIAVIIIVLAMIGAVLFSIVSANFVSKICNKKVETNV